MFQDTKSVYRNQLCFANNKHPKEKLRTQSPLQQHKIVKYLGIGLTKKVKDLHIEIYQTFMKEIEEDTNKWKDIPYS